MTIVLVMVATQYNVTIGVIVLLMMIVFNNTIVEGMENKEDDINKQPDDVSRKMVDDSKDNSSHDDTVNDTTDKVDDVSNFRNDYCIDGKLTLDGKLVTMGTLKENFPDLTFKGDVCDPCDKDCQFEIISSNERLTVEENMRATDSNTEQVDHKEAIKKRE